MKPSMQFLFREFYRPARQLRVRIGEIAADLRGSEGPFRHEQNRSPERLARHARHLEVLAHQVRFYPVARCLVGLPPRAELELAVALSGGHVSQSQYLCFVQEVRSALGLWSPPAERVTPAKYVHVA